MFADIHHIRTAANEATAHSIRSAADSPAAGPARTPDMWNAEQAVSKPESVMVTSAVRGVFKTNEAARAEAMALTARSNR